MSSEWLEAHGEGYSVDVDAVEYLDVVGCSSDDDVDGPRSRCWIGWEVGRRKEPGAKGLEIRSLNPLAVLCKALGRGAGT